MINDSGLNMSEQVKTSTAKEQRTRQESELLKILLNHASEKEYSFALWRLPNSQTKNLILSFSHSNVSLTETLEELPEGFAFAPFDKTQPANFLKADLSFSFENDKLAEPVTPLQNLSHQWLSQFNSEKETKRSSYYINKNYKTDFVSEKDNFTSLIQSCIKLIESEVVEKVVPSRKKEIDLSDAFDIIHSFQKLCSRYPNAMISLIGIPTVGTWLGATPELLVCVEDKSIFKTVSLAGTKRFQEGTDLKQVAWTQKEIEEQALVSRYIINNFKKIRLREFDEHGPKTIVAGNLMHLKTEFTVDMKATNFPQLGSVMLQLLHPTSAVCGMPLEPALEFLEQHEGYNREYYSGYIGPINTQNNTYLFVNLRCMQLLGNRAVVYAGAGVTIDSVPDTEWEETEMKLNTLLNVIL